MKLQFTKMHGAGNDFIVIDSTEAPFTMTTNQLRFIADRHLGIGADQILIVEKARTPDTDFRYRIFNQDGGEVEMCGNGARCFARFVYDRGLTTKKKIRVETMKGSIQPELQDDGRVKVDMGAPRFRPEEIPLDTTGLSHLSRASDTLWEVKAAGYNNWVSVVSMGNPHAVMVVGDVEQAPVSTVGPATRECGLPAGCQPYGRQAPRLGARRRGDPRLRYRRLRGCRCRYAPRTLRLRG